MKQAIVTKYLGPTNRRGARVKAIADGGTIIVPWNHSMTTEENHTWALSRLVRQLNWGSEKDYVSGWAANGTYVHVSKNDRKNRLLRQNPRW